MFLTLGFLFKKIIFLLFCVVQCASITTFVDVWWHLLEYLLSTFTWEFWGLNPRQQTCAGSGFTYWAISLANFHYTFVCICGIFVCICGIWECHGTCVEVEDRLWELHLSFHDVGSLNWIWVIRLGSKHLFLLSHLLPPSLRFYERTSNCISLWRCYPCTLILKCILILGAVMYERWFILEIRLCSWITWTDFSYR